MSPTMHDVARLAKVSIKTVSNVLNDYPYIRPATKQRVLDAIDALDYTPNLTARGLRSGRTGLINLIIPVPAERLLRRAGRRVDAGGRRPGTVGDHRPVRRRPEVGARAAARAARAAWSTASCSARWRSASSDTPLLAKVKTPMVLLGERILDGPKDHVTMRNTEGARAATEHLLAQGRRRIVAFGTDPNMEHGSAGLRLDGYRQALEAAGVPFDPALTVDVIGWFRGTGATAMRSFLERGIPFDGVVGFNDLIALGAMRVLQEAGLRVPHDVAVIGFDDIDEARYSLPSLSTIDPGREEIAEVAVRLPEATNRL